MSANFKWDTSAIVRVGHGQIMIKISYESVTAVKIYTSCKKRVARRSKPKKQPWFRDSWVRPEHELSDTTRTPVQTDITTKTRVVLPVSIFWVKHFVIEVSVLSKFVTLPIFFQKFSLTTGQLFRNSFWHFGRNCQTPFPKKKIVFFDIFLLLKFYPACIFQFFYSPGWIMKNSLISNLIITATNWNSKLSLVTKNQCDFFPIFSKKVSQNLLMKNFIVKRQFPTVSGLFTQTDTTGCFFSTATCIFLITFQRIKWSTWYFVSVKWRL